MAVLERRSLRRLGSTKELPVAAWIIAATNRDIEDLVKRGEFRSDLYYRLNVITLIMPSLRDRGNDIVLLSNYFANLTSKRYGLTFEGFSKDTLQEIKEYSWQGNVRELKNFVANGLKFEAKVGETDDLISATLLVLRISNHLAKYDDRIHERMAQNAGDDDEFGFEEPLPMGII